MELKAIQSEMDMNMPTRQSKNLKTQDDRFIAIQDMLYAKREFLLDKQKKLRQITKQNEYLDSVKNDYAKYYSYVADQKKDQIKALGLLEEYIKDLTVSGNLSKHNLEDAQTEQERIMSEVKKIKQSLDALIEN